MTENGIYTLHNTFAAAVLGGEKMEISTTFSYNNKITLSQRSFSCCSIFIIHEFLYARSPSYSMMKNRTHALLHRK
jgi:hypothetical protein